MISSIVAAVSFLLFLSYQAHGIYAGDSGDLVTAAVLGGVPHPPGYPLYTFVGFLFAKLPLFTPAWRVTLLSSIPHALVIALVYIQTKRLTASSLAGIFSALVLLGNYLFFLYAITPEVFALFDLFVILLIFVSLLFFESKKLWLLPLLFGITSLSITHHQVIVFLIPAIAFLFIQSRNLLHWKNIRPIALPSVILCCLGLLPLLYIPIAARGTAIINWDRAVDIPNIIRLLTRADYGSFVSGGSIGNSLYERFLSIRAYAEFLWTDWNVIGLLGSTLGLWSLFKRKRTIFWFFVIALLSIGPGFFFYASFPLVNRFLLGTYERFLLPSYVMISILMGVGCAEIFRLNFSKNPFTRHTAPLLKKGLVTLLFLYSFILMGMTLWRFNGMRIDRTADHLGQDILASAPPSSLVILSGDTPLFITQYVRYALNIRHDTVVIHAARLSFPEYRDSLHRLYPGLELPEQTEQSYLPGFIRANISKYPIVSNTIYPLGKGWYWIPHGLLYQVISEENTPTIEKTLTDNQKLFAVFYSPKNGILSQYRHLMLEDILDTYAYPLLNLGNALFRAGKFKDARDVFSLAEAYEGDSSLTVALMKKGIAESALGECSNAMESFTKSASLPYADTASLLLYKTITVRDCFHDASRAAELQREFDALEQAKETPLH